MTLTVPLTCCAGAAADGGYPGRAMGSRTAIGAVVVAVAVAVIVVVVGFSLAGGDSASSTEEYRAEVVKSRDRIDFALGRLPKAQSPEELVNRIEEASDIVDASARALDDVDPPSELGAMNDKLVGTLHAFSDELAGTAGTLSDPSFAGTLAGLTSLSFKEWESVNSLLAELRENGIQVEPLSRHQVEG